MTTVEITYNEPRESYQSDASPPEGRTKNHRHPLQETYAISRDHTSGNNGDTKNLSVIASQTKHGSVQVRAAPRIITVSMLIYFLRNPDVFGQTQCPPQKAMKVYIQTRLEKIYHNDCPRFHLPQILCAK